MPALAPTSWASRTAERQRFAPPSRWSTAPTRARMGVSATRISSSGWWANDRSDCRTRTQRRPIQPVCRWPLGVVGLRCRNKVLSGASGLEPKHKGGKDDPSAIVDRPLVVAGSHRLPLRDVAPVRSRQRMLLITSRWSRHCPLAGHSGAAAGPAAPRPAPSVRHVLLSSCLLSPCFAGPSPDSTGFSRAIRQALVGRSPSRRSGESRSPGT
jgi:hypothetical protein